MNLIFVGPQGSGKGTQAEIISKRLGLKYLEVGALVREKAKEDSPLGQEINDIANVGGKLLPDKITIALVEEKLDSLGLGEGIIFDGYPRSTIQFEALEEYLKKRRQKVDGVIFLTLSEAGSIERLSTRRICSKCGRSFNLITNQPKIAGVCDACGGELIQRVDDTPERIKIRLKEYRAQTEPLISLWRKMGILEEIDGERPIEEISRDILERLTR